MTIVDLRSDTVTRPTAAMLRAIMVYVDVSGTGEDAATFVQGMKARGILTHATGPRSLRFVTHLQVDDAGVDATLAAFGEVAEG